MLGIAAASGANITRAHVGSRAKEARILYYSTDQPCFAISHAPELQSNRVTKCSCRSIARAEGSPEESEDLVEIIDAF